MKIRLVEFGDGMWKWELQKHTFGHAGNGTFWYMVDATRYPTRKDALEMAEKYKKGIDMQRLAAITKTTEELEL